MNFAAARKTFLSSFVLWIAFALVSLYFVLPIRKHLKFGIDLVGGTYITLDVKVDKAVEYELRERLQRLPQILKDSKRELPLSSKIDNNQIVVIFDSEQGAANGQLVVKDYFNDLKASIEGKTLLLIFSNEKVNEIKRWALQSNIEVLNTRLKKIGVEEITVSARGDKSIIVELPDVDDPTKAKEIIGTPAMLEFKLVEKMGSTEEEISDEYGGVLPDEMQIIPDKDINKGEKRYYLVSSHADVTGRDLKDASPGFGGRPGAGVVVNFKLSPEGGSKFKELTGKNVGRWLAAILDGRVVSYAKINEEIGAEGSISGSFTPEKAKELAILLKSGAFVAPVEFAEERRIGPSLGYESIKNGLLSCLIGLGLLFMFSLYYYKLSGLFAFFALIYNLLLILIGMSLLRATLTLPGIAGMVLTVGMAIDASILIYEKIKESLASGASVKHAVNDGFSDAIVVILDSNITTFIVAVVLFKFGTGPIKGFAVTMMIGIISTLITGLFFLKSIFNFILGIKNVQKLSI